MTARTKILIAGAFAVLAISACGAGGGNVYVGVGVVGPYGGYPGAYPYPTYIGRPPGRYWEEDAEDALLQAEVEGPKDWERAGEIHVPAGPDEEEESE